MKKHKKKIAPQIRHWEIKHNAVKKWNIDELKSEILLFILRQEKPYYFTSEFLTKKYNTRRSIVQTALFRIKSEGIPDCYIREENKKKGSWFPTVYCLCKRSSEQGCYYEYS